MSIQICLFSPLLSAQSAAHHGSCSGDLNFTSHRINMRFYFQRNNKETSNAETQDMLIRQYARTWLLFFTNMEYLNSKHVDLSILWISTLLLLSYNIYKLYVCKIEYSKLKVKIVKYLVSNSHKILMWPALRRLAHSLGVGTMTRPNTKKSICNKASHL